MGQVCSGAKNEAHKGSAFQDVSDPVYLDDKSNPQNVTKQPSSTADPTSLLPSHTLEQQHHQQLQHQHQLTPTAPTPEEKRMLLKQQQEQQRLELVVQAAGRGMVPVRTTRGSNGYYDQGFAAALRQHLEQTTTFMAQLPVVLPAPAASSTTSTASAAADDNDTKNNDSRSNARQPTTASKQLYDQLSRPAWNDLALVADSSGQGSQDPVQYMDHLAEVLLDATKPQPLLSGVKPVVENLL